MIWKLVAAWMAAEAAAHEFRPRGRRDPWSERMKWLRIAAALAAVGGLTWWGLT